jgi:hypothetical protein
MPYTMGRAIPHAEDPYHLPPGRHAGVGGIVSVLMMAYPKIIRTTPTIRRETPRPRASVQNLHDYCEPRLALYLSEP